ncbi:MerR family transcriptional regulator [Streptomyces mashuensis]|uniref:MerR family transcriptional regulator n=1 Tax=Streptomyces mashuensis TaxID=33904 RepID=A0A919B403_9ACTN|nr:MerR family transcriptional regulator [Streptomyces mashuensis]GHF47091.1 MerR family transcriptional regulator [Streptomyces mashuensis]
MFSIGELAERAGVTVKTVRFYSDRGLLPETARSAGGHRRYGPEALDRLHLIRSLRALDLPLPQVRRILAEEEDGDEGGGATLEEAVAGRLTALGSELRALRWREAGLRVVQEAPPEERTDRLRLLGTMTAPPSTEAVARFWRAWLPPRMSARARSAFLERAVPHPPDEPAPAQVLAFARLHAFVTRPCGRDERGQPEVHRAAGARGAAVLYEGLAEAYDLAAARLRHDRPPAPGEALDCFVATYASVYGTRDTAGFRRALAGQLTNDPRIDRYWDLVSEVTTAPGTRPEPTPGTAHAWLVGALAVGVA